MNLRIFMSLLGLILTTSVFSQTDCVYDPSSLSDEFLKIPEVKCYEWDDEAKKASAILQGGATMHVQKWACVHYGVRASLFMSYDEEIDAEALMRKLASITASQTVQDVLTAFIESKPEWTSDGNFEHWIENEFYTELMIRGTKDDDFISIHLYFYQN